MATQIPFNDIEADLDFNVRTQYDNKEIQDLAESIKAQGLQTPLTVTKNGGDKLKLVSGYRRYMALKSLKWGSKPVDVVVREYETRGAMYLSNLAENTAREDVTTFDQARRYFQLESGIFSEVEEGADASETAPPEKMERKQIALATSLSTAHIGNLVRAYKNLSDASKSAWQKGFMAGGKRHELPLSIVFHLARSQDGKPLTEEEQEVEMSEFIEAQEASMSEDGKRKRAPNKKDKKDADDDDNDSSNAPTKRMIREVWTTLSEKAEKEPLKGLDKAFMDGKIQMLRFILGEISARGVTPTTYNK